VLYVLLTGRPGIGKTTVFMRVLSRLKEKGIRIAGFMCPEVREGRARVGFKIVDIRTGKWAWLALRSDKAVEMGKSGSLRIGKYVVIEDEALSVGLKALEGLSGVDVLAIDELGPMELSIEVLRRRIGEAISEVRRGILVVHRSFRDQLLWAVIKKHGYKLYQVTLSNRDSLPSIVTEILLSSLSG